MLGVLIGKTYAYMIRHELALERGDESDIQLQLQQAITIANAVIDHSSQMLSHMSMQDKLKNGIAIATEFIVAPYIFKAMHALCGKIRPVAAGIMHALQDEQNIERFNNSGLGKAVAKVREGAEKGIEKLAKAVKVGLDTLIPEVANSYDHIVAAVKNINSNKIHHILTLETKKHAWHKVVAGEVTWEKVEKIIIKVMCEGKISPEKAVFKKTYTINRELVEVVFAPKFDKTIAIADAWVRTI